MESNKSAAGKIKSTLGAIGTSLYWQRVVLNQSKDPKQKERAKKAIERLEAEIESISMTSKG
jgi:hypothetical protein